jgi:hypothetical protein
MPHILNTKKKWRVYVRWFVIVPIVAILLGLFLWIWYWYQDASHGKPPQYGVTFSTKYSKDLGLDWRTVYSESLDDLGVRLYRIPVYWDEIESQKGDITLDDVQWMMDEASMRNARVVLAIGERVPRWPECHPPDWAEQLPTAERQQAERHMIESIVSQFKDHPALYRWQVENEPFFRVFGECPLPDPIFIRQTIQEVKTIDPNHQVMVTDSGELSTWVRTADVADVLGISMYRTTWNPFVGYFHYPLPPVHYARKARVIQPLVQQIVISELQTEPWVPSGMYGTPIDEQFRSMNPQRFQQAVDYAQRTGISEVYLWGIEWWYWLKQRHSYPDMWNVAKSLFTQSR